MFKKVISSLILFILMFVAYEILTTSKDILNSVTFSFQIWKENIFPSLFPFFVLSELLIQFGFVEFTSELMKPIMVKIFKTNSNGAFVLIMSIISGFPASAKYIKELYKNDLIDNNTGTKLLLYTHFSNPLFILGPVSLIFLNNREAGLLVLIAHYLTNFIIAICMRNYHPTKEKSISFSLNKAILEMTLKRINNKKSLGSIVTSSLNSAISTLLLVLGTITMFLVITTIIDNNIHLNTFHQGILNGIIEMTQGLKYISLLHIPLSLKCALSTMILSFGGLSVHMQVFSILSDTKIKYMPFLVARIMHAIISGITVYIVSSYWLTLF